MTSLLRTLLTLALLGGTFAAAGASSLPDPPLKDLAGQPRRLSGLTGSITVVSFWATWCGPCVEELPRLVALQQRYAAHGVRFLLISVDTSKDRAKIEPFLRSRNIHLDVWTGAHRDTLESLGLAHSVPATLVLAPDGEPIGRILGDASNQDITGFLDFLLHGRQGSAPPPLLKHY
jgi:thiol-disulfide isomerase/thioredoxin